MHHVIEHTIDPLALVRAAHRRLVPGGRLVVRSPNSRYIRSHRETIRAHWYGFPKHLHIFGPESLRRLLVLGGFGQAETGCTTKEMFWPEHLQYLTNMIGQDPALAHSYPAELSAEMVGAGQAKELYGVATR